MLTSLSFYRGAEQSGSADVQRTASGEMLPTTELHWWRTSVEGKQEHYFTTRLTDSTIVDMKLHMPCEVPRNAEFTQLLEVSTGLPQN